MTAGVAALATGLAALLVGVWVGARFGRRRKPPEFPNIVAREKLSGILMEGPFGVALVDSDFRILAINKAISRMLGYPPADMVGRSFLEFSHSEDISHSRKQVSKMFARELDHYQVERRYVRRDGSTVWVNLTVWAIAAEQGGGVHCLGILEDITERKHVEQALRESEAKNRVLLSVIPDAIFQLDEHGVFLDFIPAKGFKPVVPPDQFLGRRIHEVFPEALSGRMTSAVRDALETERIQTLEYELEHRGRPRSFEARIVPAGERKTLAMVRDITDRKQAERALRESEQRLRILVEQAPEAVVILDVDSGRFVEVNRRAEELFGLERDQLLQMGPVQLSPALQPDGRPSVERSWEQIERALDGEVPAFEWTHRHAGGGLIPCEVRLVSLPYAGRRLVRGSMTDITERQQVAEALRASRDALRAVFDASPLPTLMLDREGYVRMWNSAAQNTFGWTIDELLGQRPLIVPEERVAEFHQIRRAVMSGETVRGVETYRVTKDGATINVSLAAAPLCDSDGAVIGLVNALVDITPRKEAERALRESEAKYRALVEHATYGIFRASHSGEFLAVNPALVEMLGYASAEDLMAVDIRHQVYVDSEQWGRLMERFATVDRVDGVETRWKQSDDSVITVRLSGRAVRNRAGTALAVEMIAEDVTRQRALESQLRQAQKMEAIGQLTGGIAHDFNNILTAVLSNAELLAGALPNEHVLLHSEVDDIRAAARRGAAMIRKLMAFSRREHLDIERLDLGEIADELGSMLRRLLPEHIEVQVIRDPSHAIVRADRGAVEQIVLNLATNSRDAMPDGGSLTIEIREAAIDDQYRAKYGWGDPGDYVCLAVTDTGTGIEDSIRTKIFEPFFTTKPPGEGTGLGMAMVYGLIKQHGGFINVESEVGHGTTISMYFPADRGDQPVGTTAHGVAALRGGSETILLVEDEEAIRRASQRVLHRYGYRLRVAADGQEALALLLNPEVHIDLVITDVVMPKLGGQKLFATARQAGLNVRFIFTSGYAPREMTDCGSLDPALPFLHKPWTVADLLRRVREVLDQAPALPRAPAGLLARPATAR